MLQDLKIVMNQICVDISICSLKPFCNYGSREENIRYNMLGWIGIG